jgi:hypothetical protein
MCAQGVSGRSFYDGVMMEQPELISHLEQGIAPDEHQYLLIDASQLRGVPAKLKAIGQLAVSLFDQPAYSTLNHIAPYLIQLDRSIPSHSDLENKILLAVGLAWGASWINSRASLEELVTHLRSVLRITMPNGGKALFRTYDSRILQAWAGCISDEQRQRFLGPISSWWYLDADTNLPQHMAALPKITNVPATEELLITQEQQDYLANALLPDAILARLRGFQSEMVNLHPKREQRKIVAKLLAEAKKYKLTTMDDLKSFCALGFDFDLEFYDHPQVAEQLARVMKREMDVDTMMEAVPIAVWSELSTKNEHRKKPLYFS